MSRPASLHQKMDDDAERLLASFRVVLVDPGHGGNIGAVSRAMKTMGLSDLVLVRPRVPVPAIDEEALAFASGAADLLARARIVDGLDGALEDCVQVIGVSADSREFCPVPRPPDEVLDQALTLISRLHAEGFGRHADGVPPVRIALVFGTERIGLTIDQLQRCRALISIPASPVYSSLNLSQAVQIIAFVLRSRVMHRAGIVAHAREHRDAVHAAQVTELEPATHGARESLLSHLERTLIGIEFLNPAHPKKLMARLRRMFARTELRRSEVDLLRGMCTMVERQTRLLNEARAEAAARHRPERPEDPVDGTGSAGMNERN